MKPEIFAVYSCIKHPFLYKKPTALSIKSLTKGYILKTAIVKLRVQFPKFNIFNFSRIICHNKGPGSNSRFSPNRFSSAANEVGFRRF